MMQTLCLQRFTTWSPRLSKPQKHVHFLLSILTLCFDSKAEAGYIEIVINNVERNATINACASTYPLASYHPGILPSRHPCPLPQFRELFSSCCFS